MKPILFNTEMVRTILEGRKTVTRRLIKPQPEPFGKALAYKDGIWTIKGLVRYAPYQVGDVLYVRETWSEVETCNGRPFLIFKSDDNGKCADDNHKFKGWKPSLHMPKSAARIFLKVTDVRVERLHDITVDGVKQEGISLDYPLVKMIESKHLKEFVSIWNGTIKKQESDKYGWSANPFVWVYEFERVEKPERE